MNRGFAAWLLGTGTLAIPALVSCVGDDPVVSGGSTDAGADGTVTVQDTGVTTPETGASDSGQDAADAAVACPAASATLLDDVLQISATEDFVCAVRRSGSVVCWGHNRLPSNAIGDPIIVTEQAPRPVLRTSLPDPSKNRVRKVTTADGHACALVADGTMYCWGGNASGQSTGPDEKPVLAPLLVQGPGGAPLDKVTDIGMGPNHTCAVSNEQVYCWGDNSEKQLGRDSATPAFNNKPAQAAPGAASALRIGAGSLSTCGVFKNGQAQDVRCWGKNAAGSLGNEAVPDSTNTASPTTVTNAGTFVADLSTSPLGFSCIRRTGDAVACWGPNDQGQLGPVVAGGVRTGRGVSALWNASTKVVSAGGENVCVVTAQGNVSCTGNNKTGQLGIGSKDDQPHPTPETVKNEAGNAPLEKVFDVGVGGETDGGFVCAVVGPRPECGGQVYCWGRNLFGTLGIGTLDTAESLYPKKVLAPE